MAAPVYPFTVRSRDVWAIALPASIAFITEPLAGIIDIAIIGRLGDAGMLGGLVLGTLLFDALFSLAYFLRIGTAGLTAQAIGARDPRDGLLHAARALLLAVLIGLFMIALGGPIHALAAALLAPPPSAAPALEIYFFVRIWSAPFSLVNYALLGWFYGRAAARTGMMLQILIHGVNVALSLLFVYGFGWGIVGAALGTVLGNAAAALLGLVLLLRHFGGIGTVLAAIVPAELLDGTALRRMFALSRDLMIRSAALMGAYGYFAAMGSRSGEIVLSANAVLLNLMMVASFFLDGLAQAAEQLVGKSVGARFRPAFDRAYVLSMRWGLVIAGGLFAFWVLGGGLIIDLMTTNEAVRAHARDFLWVAALMALTGMPAFVYDGILVGATLNVTMRNGMIAALALFLASAMVLEPLLGNTGLWLGLHVFFLARGAYYFLALERRRGALFPDPA
ncbi:MATE family efflux transporter [Arsenicitalea aurantiaca]|uniref:MATE family efflux transporter n=1 Tax=Arsenicitalea aurantiaca TaxID=1783274 RepID=A0A433XK88_9HYPH|nr:MATE family efflux transporter [Arsenicitalea aurantiaca]RUT34502.1 MATE family efflux transporter [Arsenicitalea aurantiaca]